MEVNGAAMDIVDGLIFEPVLKTGGTNQLPQFSSITDPVIGQVVFSTNNHLYIWLGYWKLIV